MVFLSSSQIKGEDMEENELIKEIIKEVIRKLETKEIGTDKIQELKKKILVVVNGGSISIDQVFLELKRISSNYDIGVFMSESSKEIIGKKRFERYEVLEKKEAAMEYLERSEIILLPFLTKNTCAKISVGILDSTPTYIIGKALLKEKEVVAVYDSCEVKGKTPFGRRLNENISVLKEYGVKFVIAKDLGDYILEERKWNIKILKDKKVINHEDLRHLKGSRVEVSRGAIITPLARELAKENELTFEVVG